MKAGEGGKDNRKAKKICQAGQLEQEWNGLTGKTKRGQTKTSGGTQNSMVGTIGMWSPCRRQNANAWETTDWDETSWNEANWDETQTKTADRWNRQGRRQFDFESCFAC